MRLFSLAFVLTLFGIQANADHIPENTSWNPFQWYQYRVSPKRYADIIKIAALLDEYIDVTGNVPIASPSPTSERDPIVFALGQPEAIATLEEDGTPFGFPLQLLDARLLITVLEQGLGRDISLPIDPQKYGDNFFPSYFVFFLPRNGNRPASYVVLGTFGHSVRASTEVAKDVHIVGISNEPEYEFLVPLTGSDKFDSQTITHILNDGAAYDATKTGRDISLVEDAESAAANMQYTLGQMYRIGYGVPQDHSDALKWYSQSAAKGYAKAQHALGRMYAAGEGVQQDYVAAKMWFNLVIDNGHELISQEDATSVAQMNSDEIAEAQRRAGVCKRSNYTQCTF